jgi:hypothetical protein
VNRGSPWLGRACRLRSLAMPVKGDRNLLPAGSNWDSWSFMAGRMPKASSDQLVAAEPLIGRISDS